jgi:hypothetical protein
MHIPGYDLSNVANIQATLYEAFGHIELLPFCALVYAMAQAAGAPLVRKIFQFTDQRILIVSGALIFFVGAMVCGPSPRINALSWVARSTDSAAHSCYKRTSCFSFSTPFPSN